MAKLVTIFKSTTGINNKVDPVRLRYDPDTGVQELAAACNVDIDSTGRPGRRKGYSVALSQSDCHSLFSCGEYCLFVTGDALTVLEPDYSTSALRNVTPDARMSYRQIGDKIYYMNGYEKGYVQEKISYPWERETTIVSITGATNTEPIVISALHSFVSNTNVTIAGVLGNLAANGTWEITALDDMSFSLNGSSGSGEYTSGGTALQDAYVGPSTTKTFSGPPIGHLLEVYNGRMYIAEDDVLWYSEPFAYSHYHLASNWIKFPSRITMIRAVSDGIFLGDEYRTSFLSGAGAKEFITTDVADYPPVEGTSVMVNGSQIGSGEITGRTAIWTSPKGICMGGPGGHFRNLTERKLTYPSSRYGAGLYVGDRYIATLEP